MAVSPDLLLNTKAPATVAKTASTSSRNASQAGRDDASSFADVYARERQGKPVERQDGAATAARNTSGKDKSADETAEKSGTQTPGLAEAGNDLPVTEGAEQGAEVELDPLLLLGMGGQAEGADEALQTPDGELLTGWPQGQMPMTASDAAPEAEDSLMAQHSLVETQATAQKMLPAQGLAEGEAVTEAKAYLSANLLPDEMASEDGETFSLEEDFAELLDQQIAPKESRSSAVDAAPDRLNTLTQAISQQNQAQQAQRPVLVPGQPLQMQQPGLSEAVVDRVMWLSSQNLKSAEIQLDPAELGRMEIRIDMSKEHSQVTFLSPHAGVRETLEGQMQRLRDMFSQQGMSMDVNVSDQSAHGRQGEGDAESREGRGGAIAGLAGDEGEVVQGSMEISGARAGDARGLVDYYA
ncbi:flagellar hook-length control protein FliK [Stutzerimonas stutzeri]|uniref:flagellar hook-length control protein FliK n=1 Tax=Stutzerimonas stutzeri TaxID=316 RepID=UPI0015E3F838|nr:flagellar hook-length control protein FliK [Stutzerimonas stutzeri]MBA1261709.1 flagellar hook-length control protein FliK [Stutzerimonas stutzeri]